MTIIVIIMAGKYFEYLASVSFKVISLESITLAFNYDVKVVNLVGLF